MELSNKGNWIFKTFKNTSVHMKCSNQQPVILELPSQGILTLQSDCTARIEDITLVSVHQFYQELNAEFHQFPAKDVDPDVTQIIKPLGNVIINNKQQITKLRRRVNELKRNNINLRGLTFHHISGHP